REVALAAAALGALTEEDLALPGADGAEGGRTSPVPALLPAELLEPGEALHDVRDVQDRRQPLREHGRHPPGEDPGALFGLRALPWQVPDRVELDALRRLDAAAPADVRDVHGRDEDLATQVHSLAGGLVGIVHGEVGPPVPLDALLPRRGRHQ